MPTVVTADRGEIVHLAGRHRLSPALRDGAPALLAGEVSGRCGWESFFRALAGRGLAISFDEDGTARAVPRAGRPAHAAPREGPLAQARRFLRALRGEWPAG